jgi:hypothetical protein
MIRTRWAAIGAAVAISLGAGGIGISQAVGTGDEAVFVPITPCRLSDVRPAPFTVGPRTSPLGPGEVYALSGRGAVGNCALPDSASALSLNVTALNATTLTFLTFWPANQVQPVAASLNPAPGEPPTPNAVTVDLDSTGMFAVFNKAGAVNLVIDVVGYYDNLSDVLTGPVRGGNGEGVGGSICSTPGIEILVHNALGDLIDARFSFIVPDFAYGQVRSGGSLRSGSANVVSIEHPGAGQYCVHFTTNPTQAQSEATVVSINGEQ